MTLRRLLFLPLLVACHREAAQLPVATGSAQRGKELVTQYGCNVCHITPGAQGPQGMLGPTLAGVASRPTISNGTIANTPQNMTRFLQAPASMNPDTAMPALNVTPADAEDLAAYLATLR
jgi:cytochrome c2